MTKVVQIKTNFTSGKISPDLKGRVDLRAYDNGAQELKNLFISPTGGVQRRAGLLYLDTFPSYGRMIPYEYDVNTSYLIVMTHVQMHVYLDGVLQGSMASPWTSAHLDQLNFTQGPDALYITHPDVAPKKVVRSSLGAWSISDWIWAKDVTGNIQYQPYYKYAAADVTLFSSGTSGTVTITASSGVFTSSHVGVRLRIRSTECTIATYVNPTTVTASVHGTLAANPATTDWAEGAFSSYRGYPVSVVFHQDRLVIGGSRSLLNRLWFSKTGDHFNFNLGTGLDDESIDFGIVSDQVNAIRGMISSRHLQVFTSGAEWMVTGDPLSPTNIQMKRQTRIGSATDQTIAPVDVDGATLFIARNKKEIREFLYTDVEQAYQSTDLTLLSRDIIVGTTGQCYDKNRRLLFVIRADGKCASLTMYRAEGVAAWTEHDTNGQFKSMMNIGDDIYVQVFRNGAYHLEQFMDDLYLDSAAEYEFGSPASLLTGLDHLNGMTVRVIRDGLYQSDHVVSGGSVTLPGPATHVIAGLLYTHDIVPMPPNTSVFLSNGRRMRLVRLSFKLEDTAHIEVDAGHGMRTMSLPDVPYTGDISLSSYGWKGTFDDGLWRISSSDPSSFKLLSIISEIKVN